MWLYSLSEKVIVSFVWFMLEFHSLDLDRLENFMCVICNNRFDMESFGCGLEISGTTCKNRFDMLQ